MGVTKFIKQQVRRRLDNQYPPAHIENQKHLLADFFSTDEPRWLFFFDAGRYDYFDRLFPEYVEGELTRAWNGNVAYTGDWAKRHLEMDFGNRGLFTLLPIRQMKYTDYDGRKWFDIAPDLMAEEEVNARLAALGYQEAKTGNDIEFDPYKVNQAVLDSKNNLNGGVIRYSKPHPPLVGLEGITTGRQKSDQVRQALKRGEITFEDLANSYESTYRQAFKAASELIPQLDGEIVITSDHGTCLGTCKQLFHGRNLQMHDHLTIMPWFKFSSLK